MKLTEQLARGKVPTEDEELLPHEPVVIPEAREYLLWMVVELRDKAKAIAEAAGDNGLTPEQDAEVRRLVGRMADLKSQAAALQGRTEW